MKKPTLATPRSVTASLLANAEAVHPDAELLAAWGQWLATMRANYADLLEEEQFFSDLDRAADSIASLPAHTIAGIVVKLKHAFHELSGMSRDDSTEFVARDGAFADTPTDKLEGLLWNAIEDLERMAKV